MLLRLTSAVFLIPILVVSIWVGGIPFTLLIGLTSVIATIELGILKRLSGDTPLIPIAVLGTILLICLSHSVSNTTLVGWNTTVVITILSIFTVPFMIKKHHPSNKILNILVTVGIFMYCGGLMSHAIALRNIDLGAEWLYLVFAVTFINDTTALIFGKLFGSRLLIPSISPNKTWEGALAGLGSSLIACVSTFYLLEIPHETWEPYTLGLIIGLTGQIGDLFISGLKRLACVKDSGWIIPGHGGVLDRIDSIVPNLVVVYYFAL